jgi:hypothetical protein
MQELNMIWCDAWIDLTVYLSPSLAPTSLVGQLYAFFESKVEEVIRPHSIFMSVVIVVALWVLFPQRNVLKYLKHTLHSLLCCYTTADITPFPSEIFLCPDHISNDTLWSRETV